MPQPITHGLRHIRHCKNHSISSVEHFLAASALPPYERGAEGLVDFGLLLGEIIEKELLVFFLKCSVFVQAHRKLRYNSTGYEIKKQGYQKDISS